MRLQLSHEAAIKPHVAVLSLDVELYSQEIFSALRGCNEAIVAAISHLGCTELSVVIFIRKRISHTRLQLSHLAAETSHRGCIFVWSLDADL